MLTLTEYAENFEQWCLDCVMIYDKLTGRSVPFRLNAPQRRVAALMESQRRAGKPVRIILLKARQWGGSTLTQIYMAWMQLVRHKGWNSLICSHVQDASSNIRGVYSHLLRNYPEELRGPEADPRQWLFTPFEKSRNIGYIPARDCRVAVTSAYAPDAVRGSSFQMAHLSEVAFWGDGDSEAAERIVRTVGGSVPMEPDTVVVMESTADGVGNFFHSEWKRAVKGESDKRAVFVPWHEIEIYSTSLTEEEKTEWPAKFDDYELNLLHHTGLPLEKVVWYHCKRREYATHEQMMAEYPSTPEEAFAFAASPWLSAAEGEHLHVGRMETEGAERMAVIVLAPGEREEEYHLALAGTNRKGETSIVKSDACGDIESAIRWTEKIVNRHRCPCCAVRQHDSKVSQRWLDRRLGATSAEFVHCLADGDIADSDGLSVTLTPGVIAELHDCFHELLMKDKWLEPDEKSAKKLRMLKASEGDKTPMAILRLTAASLLSLPRETRISPHDFF